jgi:hypothetical protein
MIKSLMHQFSIVEGFDSMEVADNSETFKELIHLSILAPNLGGCEQSGSPQGMAHQSNCIQGS